MTKDEFYMGKALAEAEAKKEELAAAVKPLLA